MERRGKQGRYGNDGASIRSSLFCSYILLHILLSYLQWRPPPCRPGSSWYLSAARLSVCLSGCVCVCVCVPRQYFCGRHGNVRSPSVRGCFRRGWCIMSQGLLFSEGDVHRVDLSPPQSWSADWMYEALRRVRLGSSGLRRALPSLPRGLPFVWLAGTKLKGINFVPGVFECSLTLLYNYFSLPEGGRRRSWLHAHNNLINSLYLD